MKAGTTWIVQHIRTHPDIYFTYEKEISYLAYLHAKNCKFILSDDYRIKKAKKYICQSNQNKITVFNDLVTWCKNYLDSPINDQWYKNNFILQGKIRYSADFSNLNAHINDEGWKHAKSLAKNLKVLFVMRDPVQRVWSHIRFELQLHGQLDKLERWSKDELYRYAKQNHIWRNSQYSDIVKRLKKNLNRKQLKIVFFDSIITSPIDLLNDVEKFLNVEERKYNLEQLQEKINPSKNISIPPFFSEILKDELYHEAKNLREIGIDIPKTWFK